MCQYVPAATCNSYSKLPTTVCSDVHHPEGKRRDKQHGSAAEYSLAPGRQGHQFSGVIFLGAQKKGVLDGFSTVTRSDSLWINITCNPGIWQKPSCCFEGHEPSPPGDDDELGPNSSFGKKKLWAQMARIKND